MMKPYRPLTGPYCIYSAFSGGLGTLEPHVMAGEDEK
jgi:hypothetical protein